MGRLGGGVYVREGMGAAGKVQRMEETIMQENVGQSYRMDESMHGYFGCTAHRLRKTGQQWKLQRKDILGYTSKRQRTAKELSCNFTLTTPNVWRGPIHYAIPCISKGLRGKFQMACLSFVKCTRHFEITLYILNVLFRKFKIYWDVAICLDY